MSMMSRLSLLRLRFVRVAAVLILGTSIPARAAPRDALDNGLIKAELENQSLVRLENTAIKQSVEFTGDSSAVTIDGKRLAAADLALTATERHDGRIIYTYAAGPQQIQVIYELKPGWHFVSKQVRLVLPGGGSCRVDSVEAFSAVLKTPVAHEHRAAGNTGATFLRFGAVGTAKPCGLFLVIQNPQSKWSRKDGQVSMSYTPDMVWQADYGPLECDRVCLGLYRTTGVEFPAHNIGEWKYVRDPERAFENVPRVDWAETEALIRCVDAFLLFRPKKSLRVHVPWCENDYQIDVATPEGRAEWKRILDQCAACGIDHTLFTPANGEVAPLKDNADAWGWENCLWLGLGQKIRKGEWKIESDTIPPSIQEMLDYARSKNVKLVAYAYPTLGWKQDPAWTAWCKGRTGGYVGADTGDRSFQDWFVDRLTAFQKRTGISGYSFDHWWIAYEPNKEGFKPTSKYAQWFGCRRILEELRRRSPDVVIDGRQQYQWFGPWTWLGGSYPHPTTNDEQPGSFKNFPDLHFSRVSGDRQRWAAWWYRMEQFVPLDILPGYMTHQTPRGDPQGRCVRDRPFHVRDFDYLGWRYSVISSIGTAPVNHVVDYLPARDETEFKSFRPEDQRWLREWMGWTDRNRAMLQNLRPIIGPPVLGRVDGTAAISGDRGFLFLFNPNYRELQAEFTLDASIGLAQGEKFVLREMYPCTGRLLGQKAGAWNRGDKVSLPIKGPQAFVLELLPASEVQRPALLGARGTAQIDGGNLVLQGVEGEPGKSAALAVLLLPGQKPTKVTVNGREHAFQQQGDIATLDVTFAGERFDHCQQIGAYDRTFAGSTFRAEAKVPRRVFEQLESRRNAWPIPYTAEDLLATWRGPGRLLLFIQIADPNDRWDVGLKIDGKPIDLKRAYGDVYPLGRERTFAGFYADVSNITPEVHHAFEVSLPDGLQPGQFQGLFFENVEAESTREIAR
jgi:hypothetical protein